MDLGGPVGECVYCRTRRMAIGVAGLFMVLPDPGRWRLRYPAVVFCFLGADVAVDQIFLVIRNLSAGRPSDPMNLILASGALFILAGQALVLFTRAKFPQSGGDA